MAQCVSRRGVLAMLAPALAGCGLHPLYAPAAGQSDSAAARGLSQVSVGLIPERPGQELRLALQERFERGGLALARRYDLAVDLVVGTESIAIQQDTSSTRVRVVGTAHYRLTAQDPERSTLATGIARSVDGLDVFDQQFFAADQENEVVVRRVAEALADQIALQLGLFFRKRAESQAG